MLITTWLSTLGMYLMLVHTGLHSRGVANRTLSRPPGRHHGWLQSLTGRLLRFMQAFRFK